MNLNTANEFKKNAAKEEKNGDIEAKNFYEESASYRFEIAEKLKTQQVEVQSILHSGWDTINTRFFELYDEFDYIENPHFYFQKGMILFDRGETIDSILINRKIN
jgi:hypothetical protein